MLHSLGTTMKAELRPGSTSKNERLDVGHQEFDCFLHTVMFDRKWTRIDFERRTSAPVDV
jgi:hypothetical protein